MYKFETYYLDEIYKINLMHPEKFSQSEFESIVSNSFAEVIKKMNEENYFNVEELIQSDIDPSNYMYLVTNHLIQYYNFKQLPSPIGQVYFADTDWHRASENPHLGNFHKELLNKAMSAGVDLLKMEKEILDKI